LFGIGPEDFKRYGSAGVYKLLGNAVLDGTISDEINMHNTYMTVFSELGLIGGIGFFLIVLSGMQSCLIALKICSSQTEKQWVWGLGIVYLMYVIYMYTGHYLYDYPFWFLLALMLALPKSCRNARWSQFEKKSNAR
jgi:O-antigen ligase